MAALERRLRASAGTADDNSSAAFAVKPASAAQSPEPDAPLPPDTIVLPHDKARAVESAPAAPATLPDAGAASETIPPAPAAPDVTAAAQAAQAYARVMQAWIKSKAPPPGRRPAAVAPRIAT